MNLRPLKKEKKFLIVGSLKKEKGLLKGSQKVYKPWTIIIILVYKIVL